MSKENETNSTAKAVPEKAKTVVYCGPTIPGQVKQYTVFNGGMPEALAEKAKQVPAINALCVPVSKFAATRTALQTADSAESIIFDSIQKMI
jgi:hypothetical protein